MNRTKNIVKALLFPPIVIMILLVPTATIFLVYSLVCLDSNSFISITSYIIAFYTLMIWCIKIPKVITFFNNFKKENKYMKIWTTDVRLRVRVSLYGTLIWNSAYAILQLCLGFYHSSIWYYSLAGYYVCLALMRFFLSKHTTMHKPGEQMKGELIEYRTCGWIFLIINIALSVMVFLMIYQNKTTSHNKITTIAMAVYTFMAFTIAIVNVIKYRKYKSPVYSASKAISLAAACVSMITLTSTMLSSFGNNTEETLFGTYMLAGLGAAVAVFITTMAIYMIINANRQIKQIGETV